jgi:hypothetical protein
MDLKAAKRLDDTTTGVLFSIAGRFYVGQNMYMSMTSVATQNEEQDWPSAVQAWYNEVKDFNSSNISPFQ